MNISNRLFLSISIVIAVCITAAFLFPTSVWADDPPASGTIWDHVPEGGSILAEEDGSWTILDEDGNRIGNVPEGQTAPTQPESSAADDWTPEDMEGTVWDHVPENGAIRAEEDGTWTIFDEDGNQIGTYPLPEDSTPPETDPGTDGTPPDTGDSGPSLPLPLQTPLPSGAVRTSQQQADGSWTHHYRREDPDGTVVDYEIDPTDPNYPHDDPSFWRPGQTGPDRIVTDLDNGGTITSVRNADGTWTHTFESADGNIRYRLDPEDRLYPSGDPRFEDPFGDQSFLQPGAVPLGRELVGQDFAVMPETDDTHHVD